MKFPTCTSATKAGSRLRTKLEYASSASVLGFESLISPCIVVRIVQLGATSPVATAQLMSPQQNISLVWLILQSADPARVFRYFA